MRGQGLPISTIIIAAIGLIILVIMSAMVAQKMGAFGKGTREQSDAECAPPVGRIAPIEECDEPVFGSFKGLRADQVCCRQ